MSDLRPASIAAAAAPIQPLQPRLASSAAAADVETAAESGGSDDATDQVLVAWQAHYRKLELRLSEDVSEASTEESERTAARRAAGEAPREEVQVQKPGEAGMKPSLPAQGGIAITPQTRTPEPTSLAWTALPADSCASVENGAEPILAPERPELRADAGQAHAQSVLLMGADPAASDRAVPPQPERPQMGGNPTLAQVELMMDSDAPPPQIGGGGSTPLPQRPQMDDSAVRAQENVM
jgi:hypothetical protein